MSKEGAEFLCLQETKTSSFIDVRCYSLIIDYWTIIINKFIVLIQIHIIEFIWSFIIISVNFVYLT